MPTGHDDLAAGVVNGRFYVVGGSDPSGGTSLTAYDPATNAWTREAPTLTARTRSAAGVVGNILYVIGGGPDNPVVATNEAYTP